MNTEARVTRGFRLQKWYLDCVGNDRRAFFGYSGTLSWAGASFSYASAVVVGETGPSVARASAIRSAAPREEDGLIRWAPRGIGVSGSWQPLAAPVSRRLLDAPAGRIDWDCRAPVARVRVALSDGTELSGVGYVERLAMTVVPWKLPIEELRWGRFHAGSSFLLWIDWRGPKPLTLVVSNGVEERGAKVNDEGVTFADGTRLSLVSDRTLREGAALPAALAALLPKKLQHWRETKWLSRGVLAVPGAHDVEGWAIHERVHL
jgi:hypothetical protein